MFSLRYLMRFYFKEILLIFFKSFRYIWQSISQHFVGYIHSSSHAHYLSLQQIAYNEKNKSVTFVTHHYTQITPVLSRRERYGSAYVGRMVGVVFYQKSPTRYISYELHLRWEPHGTTVCVPFCF